LQQAGAEPLFPQRAGPLMTGVGYRDQHDLMAALATGGGSGHHGFARYQMGMGAYSGASFRGDSVGAGPGAR
jgi:hypothetical protein